MTYLKLSIICILLPVRLVAQFAYDTIPVSDSIPIAEYLLKSTGDFTFETTVDSANTLLINEQPMNVQKEILEKTRTDWMGDQTQGMTYWLSG